MLSVLIANPADKSCSSVLDECFFVEMLTSLPGRCVVQARGGSVFDRRRCARGGCEMFGSEGGFDHRSYL